MANTPISPKVTAAASVGGLVGMFLSFANAATPEMFSALGKWSYPAFLAVSLGAAIVAAWSKSDPLRDAGQEKQDAANVPASDAPKAVTAEAPASVFPKAAVDAAAANVLPIPDAEYVPLDKPEVAPLP